MPSGEYLANSSASTNTSPPVTCASMKHVGSVDRDERDTCSPTWHRATGGGRWNRLQPHPRRLMLNVHLRVMLSNRILERPWMRQETPAAGCAGRSDESASSMTSRSERLDHSFPSVRASDCRSPYRPSLHLGLDVLASVEHRVVGTPTRASFVSFANDPPAKLPAGRANSPLWRTG